MIQDWISLLLVGGGFLLLYGGGTLRNILQSQARRLGMWRHAATACGLSVVGSTSAWTWRLKLAAKAGPLEIRIEGAQPGNVGTRIVVVVPGPAGFREVKIRRETREEGGMPEIETGDEAFDKAFFIEGPTRLVCMLLDAEVRGLLLRVNATSQVKIAGGELQAETFDKHVAGVLPLLLDLGRRLTQKVDVVQCLIDNVLRDPKAGVRLNNLSVLILECARSPRTDEVLRIACADQSPKVRLRAAIELGPEGHRVLRKLTERTKSDDLSAQAVRALGRELPFERTATIFNNALRGRRMETACACLEVLGGSRTDEAVDTLAKVLAEEGEELAIAAAQALGTTASAAAEAPLLLALRRPELYLRVAATKALGRVGSVAAVLPLKEAAGRLSWQPEFAQAARQAIADIQSRLPDATPGQLSLAGTEAGQLSLATDPAGQLSLPVEEAGQLSLSRERKVGESESTSESKR